MNTIEKFGVTLTRMSSSDVELTCRWRNSPQVRSYMEYREPITLEMQQKWFATLDPSKQFYYIIHCSGEPAGVVNLKNYCNSSKSAEGGIYIAEEKFLHTMISYQAILAMYDFGFEPLALNSITAHILNNNTRAIRFNQALGFKKEKEQAASIENPLYNLEKETYYERTRAIREILQPISPE